ncbi:T9SS type A sorting domain-containing protein [Maribellus comscasis]|uniref:phospholipase D n=1 Tax=Maribellus comscasis TaxID=2681766 RepID=A0A6I6JTF2_9BACT|nr:phospholipase D-like domain-containing protein [Maribellus comscasis]QGY43427.1 T9SS type A sorting domain-containing protein [Maribellus comscasis]
MKTIVTFFALLISVSLFSQEKIADVRDRVGQQVTVSGIVTNGDELGSIRYFQDETAGLAAYGTSLADIKRGDSIMITGTLKDYRNLLELDPIESVTVISSGNELPAPLTLTIDEIGEDNEGQLVQINNVTFVNANGTFAGSQNYDFTSGELTGELRINANSSIVGEVIPTGGFNLIAICSQFSYNTNDNQTGYQLLPRDMDDFVSNASVTLTSPVQIDEITTTGFSLIWETNVDATSEVRFGLSPEMSDWEYSKSETEITENTFSHKINISNLAPATIVYAQTFSVLEGDTAFSSVSACATQSNSTGKINVYFNTEVDQSESTGPVAKYIGTAMEDTLIAYINRAEETIDFCIYNINNYGISNVSDALNAAADRGVEIRFITCGSTNHYGVSELNSGIPVIERPEVQDGGLMHNKFAIFDANSADATKPWVWSGSANLTSNQINTDANNILFIQDQTLAKAYQIEFEEMWGSTTNQPNTANAKFGADKTDNTPHEFIINGNRIESYFSPSDNTNQKIIDAINTANNDLSVETMLITRTDLALAISDAFDRNVEVNVITNFENDNLESVNNMLAANLLQGKYIFDDISSGVLHSKLAIIDSKDITSDPQIITGSHNWSNSANERNDENTLIIHDADIANIYFQQFAFRFSENGGNLFVKAESIEMTDLQVYPNPASEKINISSAKEFVGIEVYTLTGEKIIQNTNMNSTHKELNISNLLPGIYILKINLKTGEQNTYKIIKH